jgi:hypothetical protein
MQVADLQQFVRSLGTTLQSAGAKSAAGDLEKAAAGLEPFKDMGIAQFGDFLAQAETYARTGVLPTTGKSRTRAPKAPPQDSAEKVRNATQRVQDLYERAIDPGMQYAAIDTEIKAIDKSLKKDELVQVARNFGISKALKSKKDATEEILRKINERKESHERTQFRLQEATPTGVM